MQRNPEYLRTRSLFTGHDAGAYPLPDELLERERRAQRLADELRKPSTDLVLGEARGRFIDDVLAAIDSGADLPDPIVLRQAAEHDAATQEFRRLVDELAESAQTHVVATVQGRGEAIIVDHLRPALEETLTAATSAAEALGRTLPTAESILSAPEAVRSAFTELGTLANRYRLIRGAQVTVGSLTTPPAFDTGHVFRELRNLPDVWPQYANNLGQHKAPWPEDERGRLLWLVTSAAEPWMPTVEEQDEAFADRFPNAPALRGRRAGWTDARETVGA